MSLNCQYFRRPEALNFTSYRNLLKAPALCSTLVFVCYSPSGLNSKRFTQHSHSNFTLRVKWKLCLWCLQGRWLKARESERHFQRGATKTLQQDSGWSARRPKSLLREERWVRWGPERPGRCCDDTELKRLKASMRGQVLVVHFWENKDMFSCVT